MEGKDIFYESDVYNATYKLEKLHCTVTFHLWGRGKRGEGDGLLDAGLSEVPKIGAGTELLNFGLYKVIF